MIASTVSLDIGILGVLLAALLFAITILIGWTVKTMFDVTKELGKLDERTKDHGERIERLEQRSGR